jgi:patatin-like phospholipase/acyl hydrolase
MKVDITYPSGRMTINLENFFPASSGNLKKLLKIIDMDWQHKDLIIRDIVTWMTEEIKKTESMTRLSLKQREQRKEKLKKNLVMLS